MPILSPASDPFSIAEGLPVREILPALCAHLATEPAEGQFASAVVVAPPGAGKTTSIPPVLAAAPWRGEHERIIMLEPRRLAARAAAQRIAALRGEKVGLFAGYRTRVDSAISEHTRIEVLTEGLFLRRLLSDPMLEGVACVILDEIHERSLDADLALAFCLDLQRSLRPPASGSHVRHGGNRTPEHANERAGIYQFGPHARAERAPRHKGYRNPARYSYGHGGGCAAGTG